jgi:hypothetical protein
MALIDMLTDISSFDYQKVGQNILVRIRLLDLLPIDKLRIPPSILRMLLQDWEQLIILTILTK